MNEWEQPVPSRGPGSLRHRMDDQKGKSWGPSSCPRCGWRGVANVKPPGQRAAGDHPWDNRCPSCEIPPETDEEYEIRQQERKVGRNDPCWCGSGVKAKKCHLR